MEHSNSANSAEFVADQGGSLELGSPTDASVTPYIDFRRGDADYTHRLISKSSGLHLSGGALHVGPAILSPDQGGSLELGSTTDASVTPYIDFRRGDADYIHRLISRSSGLHLSGGALHVGKAILSPDQGGSLELGSPSDASATPYVDFLHMTTPITRRG